MFRKMRQDYIKYKHGKWTKKRPKSNSKNKNFNV